ncbi:hypothetical protein K2Q16_03855 [Patescibacteria group bacterium]|nr:hypothetical protein [Patescibacteria group bacterium]
MRSIRFFVLLFIAVFSAVKIDQVTSWNDLQSVRERMAIWLVGDLDIPMSLVAEHNPSSSHGLSIRHVFYDAKEAEAISRVVQASDFRHRCVFYGQPRLALMCVRDPNATQQ